MKRPNSMRQGFLTSIGAIRTLLSTKAGEPLDEAQLQLFFA